MKNLLSLLAVVALLAGCGTTKQLTSQELTNTLRRGESRIIISRDNSLLFIACGATVEINGSRIDTLGRGGSVARDVPAGRVIVAAQATGSFGKFVVQFDAKPGKTYRFMVSPKSDALLLGSAFGMAGDAVHANISDTAGYFQIEMVP